MQPAVLIRLHPVAPWRYGPGEGGHDRLDGLYRSDRVYSAVTIAMSRLGALEDWLEATVRASTPAVVFSSLFPFQADVLFAPPPATLWPPPPALLTAPSPVFLTKIRWNAARFVPLTLLESILTGQNILADQWMPDPESACLLRRDRPNSSPFRVLNRTRTAVDRLTPSAVHVTSTACVEFEPGSGLWAMARYADAGTESTWRPKIESAFRLLADTGFGAGRTIGWGRTAAPEFQSGQWPNLLMPKLGRALRNGQHLANGNTDATLFWLLSLYSPASADSIDWTKGAYQVTVRGGRVESATAPSANKKTARMVSEGSVLAAAEEPVGAAIDVSPEGFPHPVYRSGLALALRLPTWNDAMEAGPVETPGGEEDLVTRTCDESALLPEIEEVQPTSVSGEANEV